MHDHAPSYYAKFCLHFLRRLHSGVALIHPCNPVLPLRKLAGYVTESDYSWRVFSVTISKWQIYCKPLLNSTETYHWSPWQRRWPAATYSAPADFCFDRFPRVTVSVWWSALWCRGHLTGGISFRVAHLSPTDELLWLAHRSLRHHNSASKRPKKTHFERQQLPVSFNGILSERS